MQEYPKAFVNTAKDIFEFAPVMAPASAKGYVAPSLQPGAASSHIAKQRRTARLPLSKVHLYLQFPKPNQKRQAIPDAGASAWGSPCRRYSSCIESWAFDKGFASALHGSARGIHETGRARQDKKKEGKLAQPQTPTKELISLFGIESTDVSKRLQP